MNNGSITKIRILASGIIGALALSIGGYLISKGFEVPTYFWLIAGIAVLGVVGADIAAAILASIRT